MKGNHKKKRVAKKDGQVPIELTGITLDDEEVNSRRQVISKDVGVQVDLTAITLDDEEANFRQHSMSEDVENESDLPHIFDRINLNMNGEETLDPGHVAIPMKDPRSALNNSMLKNHRIIEVVIEQLHLTTMNIFNDIIAKLDPIVGYAETPLLPLFKACAPLTNIVYNIFFYIQLALSETPEVPSDELTIDESAAIRLYTIEWAAPHRSLYAMLNSALRNNDREHLQPYFKYMKLLLTAMVKLPCVPQSTIWRGVTRNLSTEFPPGTPVTWWSFTSCTNELAVLTSEMYLGNTGDRTLFSVETINGRTISAHSHFVTENEIVLLPGTHMIVQSQICPASDLHIIHLKQVIPDVVLLEPPFEGILNIFSQLF
jgi:hypothetical protein